MRIDDAAWKVILGRVNAPEHPPTTTPEDILRHFGVEDGKQLGLDLLESAVARRDSGDLEGALIVASCFGIDTDHFDIYLRLATEEWHRVHEDITFQLGLFGDPRAIDALVRLCDWVPDHLAWDDNRALASKAVHALARIPGDDAERALRSVLSSEDPIVRAMARRQHDKRTRQWIVDDKRTTAQRFVSDLRTHPHLFGIEGRRFDIYVAFLLGFHRARDGAWLYDFRKYLADRFGDEDRRDWATLVVTRFLGEAGLPVFAQRTPDEDERLIEGLFELFDDYFRHEPGE